MCQAGGVGRLARMSVTEVLRLSSDLPGMDGELLMACLLSSMVVPARWSGLP